LIPLHDQSEPPTNPLPDDVLNLMYLTVELVDSDPMYWKPVPTGSQGEATLTEIMERRRRNRPRTTRSGTAKTVERGSSEEWEKVGDEEMDRPN